LAQNTVLRGGGAKYFQGRSCLPCPPTSRAYVMPSPLDGCVVKLVLTAELYMRLFRVK